MYARILVAIDGSEVGDLALKHAVTLAKELGARLRIVHAVDETNAVNWDAEFGRPEEVWDALAAEGRAMLEKAAAGAARQGVEADTRLVELDNARTRIAEAIREEADAWPADVIVLGTHGRRGVSHLLLGSVAEGIVRIANHPVLLVRKTR